jgi:multisubunit Na+/H+ antiporter MnhF subunit
MTGGILARDLAELSARPRALAVKLVYPLAVGIPLLFSAAPPFYASMAITMLVALLGGLGTASVLARERASGLQLRYRLLPVAAPALMVRRVLAAAAVDAVQVIALMAVIGLRHPDRYEWWPALALALAGTLVTVDALGAFASSFADGPGEVMLYVLIPLLPAFYLSGLFVPMTGPLAVMSQLLPFTYLHAALEGAMGARVAADPLAVAGLGAVFVLAGGLLAAAGGRRVLEAE